MLKQSYHYQVIAVPLLPPVGRAQMARQWKLNQSNIHLPLAVFSGGIKKTKNPLLAQRAINKGS